ncbi:hypothetical protein FRC07_002383 [Ceratobasidium sp. 392]|nr:hypothetical protein FRC07_002383 [Ceratobasidium sp. 392]
MSTSITHQLEEIETPADKESTPTVCSQTNPAQAAKEAIRKLDFGFLPIPARLQYDPDNPSHFGLALNIFFGAACTLSR